MTTARTARRVIWAPGSLGSIFFVCPLQRNALDTVDPVQRLDELDGLGRTALVRFNEQSTGGTLELRAQGGAILQQGPLPTTVTVPPVF